MNKIYNKIRKNIFISLALLMAGVTGGVMTSCSMDITPENQESQADYWASKEDVTSALAAGYYYLRGGLQAYLIPWGEDRASVISVHGSRQYNSVNIGSSALRTFQIKSTTGVCNWTQLYKIILQANLVLKNAGKAREADATYTESEMKSHYCEAYFLRALSDFYLVRNWRRAPNVTEPYETDQTSINVPIAEESELIAQIKSDLNTAISLGAAKEVWDTNWETKGKATIWSIYALMADVCLWNKDYDEAIKYCDLILEDKTGNAPKFIEGSTHADWYKIFNPGNSQESIFELQFSASRQDGSNSTNQVSPLFDMFWDETVGNDKNQTIGSMDCYRISPNILKNYFMEDYYTYIESQKRTATYPEQMSRYMYGSYYSTTSEWKTQKYLHPSSSEENLGFVWKYIGGQTYNTMRTDNEHDANFIIYRVSDIIFMKAEALLMRNGLENVQDNGQAIELVNKIRKRANLYDSSTKDEIWKTADDAATMTSEALVNYYVRERIMESLAEGKIWYDFVRMARYGTVAGFDFKQNILIDIVATNKNSSNEIKGSTDEKRARSVLKNENAWFLPIYKTELSRNQALADEQNPFYN